MKSMTGFGSAEASCDNGVHIQCQIRTINHRYFEWKTRMPSIYLSRENDLKIKIRESIKRGVVEVFIRRDQRLGASTTTFLDATKVENLSGEIRQLYWKLGGDPKKCPADQLLTWTMSFPDLLARESSEELEPQEEKVLLEVVHRAADQVEQRRRQEGEGLLQYCKQIVAAAEIAVKKLEACVGQLPKLWAEKLRSRLATWTQDASANPQRLEQEIIFMAERSDVSEELARLHGHFKMLRELFTIKEPMGKKLDFYIQEVHREVNTMGSKVADSDASVQILELKSTIEKLREQIQNVE